MGRFAEMEAFAAVVDHGGFTDAARKLGVSKSAVSKHVLSLEARLGTRLLKRTTRRVSPTDIGLLYYDHARRVIVDAGEADSLVMAMQSAPTGLLSVCVPADFAADHIAPCLGAFLDRYPGITLNMRLANGLPNPGERFDITIHVTDAIRAVPGDCKLAETAYRLVAAPSYFAASHRPERIEDLHDHRLLHYSHEAAGGFWRLTTPTGEVREVRSAEWLAINDGPALLRAAIAGAGIAYLPGYLYGPAMRDGLIEEAMPAMPIEPQGIFANCPHGRSTLPKVSAFVEFLQEHLGNKGVTDW